MTVPTPCTAPNDGAVTVTNAAGCDPTVSGIPWRPPHTPAVTSYQVSAAYRSEHDGHTLARRFLHRANRYPGTDLKIEYSVKGHDTA